MRSFQKLLFSTLLLLLLQTQGVRSQDAQERPNVLFILVDDLNDFISGYGGHPQASTPHIEELAQSGVTFTHAYSNNPVSAPSRSSLFTGVYPHTSKKFFFSKWHQHPVLKNCKTIPEYFDQNGYHVMGSGKLFHHNLKSVWNEWGANVNNYGPFAYNGHEQVGHPSVPEPFRSIGAVDGSYAPLSDVPTFPDSISKGQRTGWMYSQWGGKAKKEGEFLDYKGPNNRDLTPDEMHVKWARQKLREMEQEGTDQPFFMGIGFVRPHTPLYAPKKYFDMFPLDEIQLPVIREEDDRDTYYDLAYPMDSKGLRYYRTLKASYPSFQEGLKHFVQAYLACIAFVDDQIGAVVQALDESSFAENTVVVLTSDHGWNMGEKDYLFKNSPWEESTRVPLIIRAPGVSTPGSRVDQPVTLIDIYPTLNDLCRLEGNTMENDQGVPLDGHSLRPFLEDSDFQGWEGPKGALSVIYGGITKEDIYKQTYSYRTKKWRYIRYHNGEEELYNHVGDPYEWQNLAHDKRFYQVKKRLKSEMMDILAGE